MTKSGEIDLTLHVDPADGKTTIEAELSQEIGKGVELDADVQVDQDGNATATIGVTIPIP